MVVRFQSGTPVTDPESVSRILQELLSQEDSLDKAKEHFYCIHLDTRNKIVAIEVVSVGTANASLVHPRETFRRAIQEGSCGLVIAHNHPSGAVEPSDEDMRVSMRLVEAGKLLDIPILDHIIFSDKAHFSLKAHDLI